MYTFNSRFNKKRCYSYKLLANWLSVIAFTLLLLFQSLNTKAQDYYDFVKPVKPSRFSVGIMLSPDYQSLFYDKTNDRESTRELKNLLSENEQGGFGFTGGIHLMYDLSKRWFVRLGGYYSNKKIVADGFVSGLFPDTVFRRAEGESLKDAYSALEIPLTFHYLLNTPYDKNKKGLCFNSYSQYNRSKPLFYIFFGPAYSTNLAKHTYESRRWTNSNDTLLTNTHATYASKGAIKRIGVYAGIGAFKYLNKNIFITVEPVFRIFPVSWYSEKFLNSAEQTSTPYSLKISSYPVKDLAWSAGIQFGFNYHF